VTGEIENGCPHSRNRPRHLVRLMAHGPLTFKKRDVEAAIKAARDAGCEVQRIEIDRDGKIVIVTGRPLETAAPALKNPWDEVLEDGR
jgi:hypothetical protein